MLCTLTSPSLLPRVLARARGFRHCVILVPSARAAAVSSAPGNSRAAQVISMASNAIDLTLSDSDEEAESPTAVAAREAAQKQRIMDFARSKRARTGPGPGEEQPSNAAAAAAAGASTQQAGTDIITQRTHAAQAADADAGAPSSSNAPSTSFGNDDLRALHEARMARMRAQAAGRKSSDDDAAGQNVDSRGSSRPGSSSGGGAAAAGPISRAAAPDWFTQQLGTSSSSGRQVSLLTYNVWFREDVAVQQRMQGIADIITSSGYPTFICLQEVTPRIQTMFASMPWWQRYISSPAPYDAPYYTLLLVNKAAAPSANSGAFEEVHFDNSCMGRSLRVGTVTVAGQKMLVATTHLESPIPPTQWYSQARKQQMGFSFTQLDKAPYGNVLFAGDMNWTDSRDGAPPLPQGWCDVWQRLHPGDPGFTYDSGNNPMLPYKNPGLRLDRVFAKLSNFKLGSVRIVGKDRLSGAMYTHTFKNGGSKQLPVLPSDHFGLLLQLVVL